MSLVSSANLDLVPLGVCVTFYTLVFTVGSLSRELVDRTLKKNSLIRAFLIELIGTAQMCTCVYENGVILKNYGVYGFFITVASLLIVGAWANRGALVSPLGLIEQAWNGTIANDRLIALLTAQSIGGYSAFRIARFLWYYSAHLASDHDAFYTELPCRVAYKLPFWAVMAFEFAGCFTVRFVAARLPVSAKPYLVGTLVSFLLSVAITYVGVPALNPVTVSSRMMNCPGIDTQWFVFTYWLIPIAGWLLAAQLDRRGSGKVAPKPATEATRQDSTEKKKKFYPAQGKKGGKAKAN